MIKFKLIKVRIIFLLLLFLPYSIFASEFILSSDGLIDERAIGKINNIGKEAKEKLDVNIYLYVKKSLALKKNISIENKLKYIKQYEYKILKNLKKPYVLLTISIDDIHVNLYTSKSLNNIIDKNDILDDYVVPLLASKDKNTVFSKTSAAVLNGYAAIADSIAEAKNIELTTSIGNSSKVASTIWRVFIYTLVVFGLLVYIYAMLRRKKV